MREVLNCSSKSLLDCDSNNALLDTALAAIALVAIVIFATQNLQVVEVDFLFWSLKLSKFLIMIGAYVMGVLTGWGKVELVRRRLQVK